LPTIERIVYGAGASLGAQIRRLGARRVMLVTHRALTASAIVSEITPRSARRMPGVSRRLWSRCRSSRSPRRRSKRCGSKPT
jgi:hypothetical protein